MGTLISDKLEKIPDWQWYGAAVAILVGLLLAFYINTLIATPRVTWWALCTNHGYCYIENGRPMVYMTRVDAEADFQRVRMMKARAFYVPVAVKGSLDFDFTDKDQ